MKNEKQTKPAKKSKHAAKPWDFIMRGGIKGINFAEIAETLSRKNPVAVVTLIPRTKPAEDELILDKEVAIVVHSSIKAKIAAVCDLTLEEYFYNSGPLSSAFSQYIGNEEFDVIVPESISLVSVLIDALHSIRQQPLRDKTEYTAAVNYPKV